MPRYTIDFDDDFKATLESLADGRTKAEVIRRAVASYYFLKKETASGVLRVTLSDKDGVCQKEIVLP